MDYFEDPNLCLICFGYHPLKYCKYFKTFTTLQRSYLVKVHKYCAKCFSKSHRTEECTLIDACAKCQGPHHVMLHQEACGDIDANTKFCESEPSCSNVLNMHRRMQRKRTNEPDSFERCSCEAYRPSCSRHIFDNSCSCRLVSSRSYEDNKAGPSKRARSFMPLQSNHKKPTTSQAPTTLVPFPATIFSWKDSGMQSTTLSSNELRTNKTSPALINQTQSPEINPLEKSRIVQNRPCSLSSSIELDINSDRRTADTNYLNTDSFYTESFRSVSLSELNFETTSRTNSASPTAENLLLINKEKQCNWRSCFSARRSRSPSIESDSEEEGGTVEGYRNEEQSFSHGSRRRSTVFGPLSIEIPKDQAQSQSSSSSNLISSSDSANFLEQDICSKEGSLSKTYLRDSSSVDRKSIRSNRALSFQRKSSRYGSWGSQQEDKMAPSHAATMQESTSAGKDPTTKKDRKTTKLSCDKDQRTPRTQLTTQTNFECQESQITSDRRYIASTKKPDKECTTNEITSISFHNIEHSEKSPANVAGSPPKRKSPLRQKFSYGKMSEEKSNNPQSNPVSPSTHSHQPSTEECATQQNFRNANYRSDYRVTRSRFRETQTIPKQVNSPSKPDQILAAIQLILKDILAHLRRHKDHWLTPATRRRQTLLRRELYQLKAQLNQLVQSIQYSTSNSQVFQKDTQKLQHLKMLLHHLRQPLKEYTSILSTRQLHSCTHQLIEYLRQHTDRSKTFENYLKQLQKFSVQCQSSERGKQVDLLPLKLRLRVILRTMLKTALDQLTKLLHV